jgi:activator of HSP90 ATPase
MKSRFTLTAHFPVQPSEIYKAWMSTKGHSKMTGSPAKVVGRVGGRFTAWDGYIFGTFLELTPDKRIVHAWRTTEFPDEAPDSRVEIHLRQAKGGTKLTLSHRNMPEEQVNEYRQGWEDFYFKPMREFFENRAS